MALRQSARGPASLWLGFRPSTPAADLLALHEESVRGENGAVADGHPVVDEGTHSNVTPAPTVLTSDLKAPSSCEWTGFRSLR